MLNGKLQALIYFMIVSGSISGMAVVKPLAVRPAAGQAIQVVAAVESKVAKDAQGSQGVLSQAEKEKQELENNPLYRKYVGFHGQLTQFFQEKQEMGEKLDPVSQIVLSKMLIKRVCELGHKALKNPGCERHMDTVIKFGNYLMGLGKDKIKRICFKFYMQFVFARYIDDLAQHLVKTKLVSEEDALAIMEAFTDHD